MPQVSKPGKKARFSPRYVLKQSVENAAPVLRPGAQRRDFT
jgi:hypothetical protein